MVHLASKWEVHLKTSDICDMKFIILSAYSVSSAVNRLASIAGRLPRPRSCFGEQNHGDYIVSKTYFFHQSDNRSSDLTILQCLLGLVGYDVGLIQYGLIKLSLSYPKVASSILAEDIHFLIF